MHRLFTNLCESFAVALNFSSPGNSIKTFLMFPDFNYNLISTIYSFWLWIPIANQRFQVRFRTLAMCRGDLSAIIVKRCKRLWNGWKWHSGVQIDLLFPLLSCNSWIFSAKNPRGKNFIRHLHMKRIAIYGPLLIVISWYLSIHLQMKIQKP